MPLIGIFFRHFMPLLSLFFYPAQFHFPIYCLDVISASLD
jgi:hypothetical protein